MQMFNTTHVNLGIDVNISRLKMSSILSELLLESCNNKCDRYVSVYTNNRQGYDILLIKWVCTILAAII